MAATRLQDDAAAEAIDACCSMRLQHKARRLLEGHANICLGRVVRERGAGRSVAHHRGASPQRQKNRSSGRMRKCLIGFGRQVPLAMMLRLLTKVLIGLIRLYQLSISPFITPSCRYQPSCSRYAIEAIRLHGPVQGSWLALRRILRCHPWGNWGYDPVPPKSPPERIEPGKE
jgi:putative membrane protein insertion efficiency factor